MKKTEFTGKTVEEALQNALKQLNVTKDKVEVEIIEKGSKGFFNLIGAKVAKIYVTVKRDYVNEGQIFLRNVLNSMNIKAEIRVREENNVVYYDLAAAKIGLIIGYRGETLDSLQYLVSLVVNKDHDTSYKRVVLDAENYRNKRKQALEKLATRTAEKVKRFKRAVKLEPMNPYERRIVHSALQDNEYVYTFSEGGEPHRRIVIDIKK